MRIVADEDETHDQIPLAPVKAPQGLKFYLGTWSGKILLINFIVFVLMSLQSSSIMLPTTEVLLKFGAKDQVGIALGEYWRFFTPVFVHIGIIHFFFNSLGLYYIGYQVESLLGPQWFLIVYVMSGVIGNIASSVFSLALSAGASGALFGLLGCGFYLECSIGNKIAQMTGRRPRRGIYTSMVVVNVIFGFVIPGIDNAAHLGGLVSGMLMTLAIVNLRPNRLQGLNKVKGLFILLMILLMSLGAIKWTSSSERTLNRYREAGDSAHSAQESYIYYSQALRLEPLNRDIRLKRGRLLMFVHQEETALEDLKMVAEDPQYDDELTKLADELEASGQALNSWKVRQLVLKRGI